MTTPSADQPGAGATPNPPLECPAHRGAPGDAPKLYGPEIDADPQAFYTELRNDHGPVAPVELPGGRFAWVVLGYEENKLAMENEALFSHDSHNWIPREGPLAADDPLLPVTAPQDMCSFKDGEAHQRLSVPVTRGIERFDRHRIRRYTERFANQLVDAFIADGKADLVEQYAAHLPMMTMTQVMGMPEDYSPQLVAATRDMMTASETAYASNEFLVQTLQQFVHRKQAEQEAKGKEGKTDQEPSDFISSLLFHNTESPLTETEVVEQLRMVLIASYEATANLILEIALMIMIDRRFRGSLNAGHMPVPEAVEQVLWDAPPFTRVIGRWATTDLEFGGQQIQEGDMLVLEVAAANTDPKVRPDLSVPLHGNSSHLAFSAGAHVCPGAEIGRGIADTGIDVLRRRLRNLELAVPEEDLRRETNLLTSRILELPCVFTPGRATASEKPTWTSAPPTRAPLPTPEPPRASGSSRMQTSPASVPPPPAEPAPASGRARFGWLISAVIRLWRGEV